MHTRRTELEIISDILKLSKKGAKKTEILYQGNFSYTQLSSYLDLLLEHSILEQRTISKGDRRAHLFFTTEKGSHLLETIRHAMTFFKK